MKNKIELSIILPVFNEEKNIKLIVDKYKNLSKNNSIEVIFVEDGGSKDKTREELEKFAKKHSFVKPLFTNEPGYGISIYNGLKNATGEFLCWTHADMQTDPKDTIEGLKMIKAQQTPNKCFIKGKRYGRQLLDVFFTFGMSIFETLYLGKIMYDINAQPNIFHKSFLELMKDPPKDFSFDLYTYYLAKKNKFNIVRFPTFFGKRIYGESAWNDGMKARFKFIKRTIDFTFKLRRKLLN
jgi:glycosyltransferase involved in cell wall biosynthesis